MSKDTSNNSKTIMVPMTFVEVHSLMNVVAKLEVDGQIPKEDEGPINWVMSRIHRLFKEKVEQNEEN